MIQLLETLYICCSIETMLRVTLKILSKYIVKSPYLHVKPFQQYFIWLGQKMQLQIKSDATLMEMASK